jgi:hypothetical protein
VTQTNPTPTLEEQVAQLTKLVAALAQQPVPAAADATTSPAAPIEEPLQSEVAPPAVSSLVSQTLTVPGDEHPTTHYGIVCAVDPTTNTARVAWFTNTSDVRGDALTEVE